MSAIDYDPCEVRVLAHEGGYTNDPRDPGGPTNWGITIFDARMYWKSNASAADVKAMPVSVAKDIYRQKYWNRMRCDDLAPGVDDSIFDYGVNSGTGRAAKVLGRVLRINEPATTITDGMIRLAATKHPADLINAINDERLAFLHSLSTWDHFGPGWGRRVSEVRAFSLHLTTTAAPVEAPAAPEVQPPQPAPAPAPAPTPTPADSLPPQGKGAVPKPKVLKGAAKASTVPAAAGGYAFRDWLMAHPWEAGLIATAGVATIGGAIYLIEQNHARQQLAIPAGWTPPQLREVAPAA